MLYFRISSYDMVEFLFSNEMQPAFLAENKSLLIKAFRYLEKLASSFSICLLHILIDSMVCVEFL